MRRGADAEEEMMSLFAHDAVYDEPFSGSDTSAVGHDAIRARLCEGWQQPLPDLELDVLSLEVTSTTATSHWECRSAAFPSPVRGTDHYEFVDGKISRLIVMINT